MGLISGLKALNEFLNKDLSEMKVLGTVVKGGKAAAGAISKKRHSDAKAQKQVPQTVVEAARLAWRNGKFATRGVELKAGSVKIVFEESECVLWVLPPKAKLEAVSDALTLCDVPHKQVTLDKGTLLKIEDVSSVVENATDIIIAARCL